MEHTFQLDRALYKRIKGFDKAQMQQFISNIYQTAVDDMQGNAVSLDIEKLRSELSQIKGIGENRLNEIMAVIEKNLESE
ncbi:MAG: hypothetical protein IJN05_06220 [Ruminococcus sp.]|nr:hypothetical protein [Ruminococcus sp.]MBQ7008795.1 hypothetical protein [Ruminococcus sp.]